MIGGGMMNGFGGFGTLGLIGGLLNLVITIGIIAGVVLFVVWLVRRLDIGSGQPYRSTQRPEPPASPREILQTRYASGEITREQYQEMLSDLS